MLMFAASPVGAARRSPCMPSAAMITSRPARANDQRFFMRLLLKMRPVVGADPKHLRLHFVRLCVLLDDELERLDRDALPPPGERLQSTARRLVVGSVDRDSEGADSIDPGGVLVALRPAIHLDA